VSVASADARVAADPRRWITLAIVVLSLIIVVLDSTVLNVAIPTILRDFDTQLPSLQWVLTGYSLTFATLLIIGGRLGDIYGARRMFIIGAALFGVGSLLASEATSVPTLLVGESIIEGIGASLMMPATLAILSTTFDGPERAKAFAVWGATAGAAVAFGPLVGGFLTTNYSWRWSFRINLVVAPLAIIGALLFIRRTASPGRRQRIDIPGAMLVAAGMFSLVFALSEGGAYGWLTPIRPLAVMGREVWPSTRAISAIPFVLVAAVVLLSCFYAYERRRERAALDPLFEFGQLRHLGFRYGLLTTAVLAMGQLGFLFVLPVFLQDGKHLSAVENGLWLVPSGLFIVIGAQLGGRLTRRINTTYVVRYGLALEAVGLCAIAMVITPRLTLPVLLPGLALFGIGLGFASSQLTNVVLSDIPNDHAGAASGANTTVRQIGAALGIAIIGSLLNTQTIRSAVDRVSTSTLPTGLKSQAIRQLHTSGVGFTPPRGISVANAASLRATLESSIAAGARPALLFAAAVVSIGAVLSLLIPKLVQPATGDRIEAIDTIDPVEALDALAT
jgi:EmrB/QacA subfamily drug resistance transporter